MKKTLLEIVQDIGFLIETGEIASIMETYESEQIARVVKHTYEAMMVNGEWPHLNRLATLIASSDNNLPTHVTIQDKVAKIYSIAYNKEKLGSVREMYEEIKYISPDTFLKRCYREDTSSPKVMTVQDPSGTNLFIRNDGAPTYCTTFDNTVLVFNSYDSQVDSTLQASKIQARVKIIPQFVMDDLYVPDLPEDAFPALFEEALSRASITIRQVVDNKAEQEARRQRQWLSRNYGRAEEIRVKYPNYGRRTR